MIRLSKIASLSLVFILLLAGCRSARKPRGSKVKPIVSSSVVESTVTGSTQTEITSPEGATAIEPGSVVFTTPGSQAYSRIYPCEGCGVVQLDKTMPKEVESGKEFKYSIKVTNMTDITLVDVVLTEEIPDGFNYTSAEPTAEIDGKKLIWRIGSLRPKASTEVTVTGAANDITELQYCTTVATPLVPMCARIAVVQPRLTLEKDIPAGALVCDMIPVRYVVSNVGTGGAQGVRIIDTLPEGLTTADGLNELVIEAGALNPGQSREFKGSLKAAKAGAYVTKAIASTADGLKVETKAVTTTVGQPVLTITQSGPEKLYLGRTATYEITVTNTSDAPARNAIIENEIPGSVTAMKTTAGAKLVDSKIVWSIGTLGPNATKTVKVSFTPTKPGTLVNRATAMSDCAESVSATSETDVAAIAAVLLEVVDVTDPVEIGDRTTYVITVTNQGSAASKNVRIVCTLEENMQYLSSTGTTRGTAEENVITFEPLDRLTRGSKAQWQVTVTALKAGDVRFKVTLNSDELTRPVEETEATRIYE